MYTCTCSYRTKRRNTVRTLCKYGHDSILCGDLNIVFNNGMTRITGQTYYQLVFNLRALYEFSHVIGNIFILTIILKHFI